MQPKLCQGEVIKWEDKRGFGFIKPVDGSPEVFLHISEMKDPTRRPQVGDKIYYNVVVKDRKIRACNAFFLGATSTNSTSTSSPNPETSKRSNRSSFPILEALLLSALPLLGSLHFAWKTGNSIPIILYISMGLFTYFLYADDKARAKQGRWRTPENTLHFCELIGGWIGGFIAQRKLHHKTIKSSYQFVFWLIVVIHLAFWIDWLFFGGIVIKKISGGI